MATEAIAQATLLDGETVPAAEWRRQLLGGVYPSAGIVSGLRAVSTPTPSMKVRLPAGLCVVDDGAGGFVPLYLLTQTDLDIATSSATLARIDSLIGEVVDTGVTATLIRRFRVITGTPAASPTAPTLPPADQPTARTLRLANVFVQANAETNGNVRPQDVTVVAPAASLVQRPVSTSQVTPVSGNNFGSFSTWVDFTSGQWPAMSFVVPPSGQAYITISANVGSNPGSASSTLWASWRGTGGGIATGTASTVVDPRGVSSRGPSRCFASKRQLISGLTPGATVTITPIWFASSTSGDTGTRIGEGSLLAEPVT